MSCPDFAGVFGRPVLRRRIMLGLQSAFQWTGAAAAYVRALDVHGAVILMYHSVAEPAVERWIVPHNRTRPELFAEQMQFLSRYRNVISIDGLTRAIGSGRSIEAGTVVITFDDGYLDTYTVAAQILAHYRLPAILYLPTESVNNAENQWADRLYGMFASRTRDSLTSPQGSYDLADTHARRKAFARLHGALITCQPSGREKQLQLLAQQLSPDSPPRLTLTWKEVRQMIRQYPLMSIGVHSANHIDLTACNLAGVRQEVMQCIADLERETELRAEHFSFPYNRCSEQACSVLREFGLKSAVASGGGLVTSWSDCYALPRLSVPDGMALFRFWTSGAYPGLPLSLLGRA